MRPGIAVLLAVGWSALGCYNYEPLRGSGLTPSTYLAITLSEAGSEELASYLGPDVLVVRGRYLGPGEHGVLLAVEAVETRRGDIAPWAGETVQVPGEFVRGVEERHASRQKSVLLAGSALASFVFAYAAFGSGAAGGAAGRAGSGTSAH
jgi:hypothetical protein